MLGSLLVAAILLTACGDHNLSHGTVIEKQHADGYTYVAFIPVYTGKTTMLIPYIVTRPAYWRLKMQDCQTACETGYLYTTPERWAGINVGDMIGQTAEDSTNPPAETRRRQ